MLQDVLIFVYQRIVIESRICHDQAIKWVTRSRECGCLTDDSVEIFGTYLETDAVRQILDDRISGVFYPLDLE
jgi:hypothetical protein